MPAVLRHQTKAGHPDREAVRASVDAVEECDRGYGSRAAARAFEPLSAVGWRMKSLTRRRDPAQLTMRVEQKRGIAKRIVARCGIIREQRGAPETMKVTRVAVPAVPALVIATPTIAGRRQGEIVNAQDESMKCPSSRRHVSMTRAATRQLDGRARIARAETT